MQVFDDPLCTASCTHGHNIVAGIRGHATFHESQAYNEQGVLSIERAWSWTPLQAIKSYCSFERSFVIVTSAVARAY